MSVASYGACYSLRTKFLAVEGFRILSFVLYTIRGGRAEGGRNVRGSRSSRRRGRSGAYEFGRLAIVALIVIVLVIVLLRLLGLA
jgi:hypothetical protein